MWATAQYSTNPRYYESPGEYVMFFKLNYNTPGTCYAVGTDNTITMTGNTGAQGIPTEIVTNQSHKQMAGVCTGLHDGGAWSADSGRVFMGGLTTNCQLGNGLTTGPSTAYEILTDYAGNQFYGVTAMTAGWGPSSGVPFYAAIESDTSTRVWVWGNGTNLGLGTCLKPTPLPLPGGRHPHKILAYNSSLHCIATDGTLWVQGGTDDYAANTGVNATPTSWTQVTLPGGALASYIVKGNAFCFVITTVGDLVFFGEYGWIGENMSSAVFTPITTPTKVNSFFPTAIFPIDTMVAAHSAYMILNTSNGVFTGGSNETGQCGTGRSIIWPTYTGGNGFAPWNWDVNMGEYVNQCTQIAKGTPAIWSKIFGGPLYSFYFLLQDTAGIRYGVGRGKVIPNGMIWADSSGTRIAAAYHMGHNILYLSKFLDYFSITSSIISSCPGCADGTLTGTPCSFGTDAPSRPNTNLHCNLVLTPITGGFNWSIATSTTDASHKIMPNVSFIVQSSGTSIPLGVPSGTSGTVLAPPGTYAITDTMVDNSWDTVEATQSVTVGQSAYYVSSSTGNDLTGNGTFATPYATYGKALSQCVAGDTIYLKRGDVFKQCAYTISYLTVTAYGTGADPVISGFTTLSTWTSLGHGIYEAFVPGDKASLNCVTLDGNLAGMGRYPDTGWVTYSALTSSTLTSSAISIFPYTFVNGSIAIRDEFSVIDTVHTTAQGTNTFTLATSPSVIGGRGNGFFMMNHPNTLLTTLRVGSWWNNTSVDSVEMFFGSAGPSGHTVQIATLDTLSYNSSDSSVTFIDIDFEGSNQFSVFENHTFNIIYDSCYFRYGGNNGVTANNAALSSFLVDTFKYFNNNGAYNTGTSPYLVLKKSLIDSCGMTAGMGKSGTSSTYEGWAWGNQFGQLIQYNAFYNIGYNGLYFSGDSANILNNFGLYYCMVKCDGAFIYTWDPSAGSYTYGRNVIGNIGLYGGSPGGGIVYDQTDISFTIYTDNYATKTFVLNNAGAFNATAGGFNHGANNTFRGNNWFDNGYCQFLMSEVSSHAITGTIYTKNVHGYSVNTTPLSIAFTTPNNDLGSFGTIDSNYYLAPINLYNTFFTKSSVDAGTNRAFASWQSNTTSDAHGTFLNWAPLFLKYSISSAFVSAYGYHRDVNNNVYSGGLNLSAYQSIILERISLPTTPIIQGGAIKFNN